MLEFEENARRLGFKNIAGIDEAGRGPLAGPVVACACVIDKGATIAGIDDSKKLSPKIRKELYEAICRHPGFSIGVGIVEHVRIDSINILQATFEAMHLAIQHVDCLVDYALVDGNQDPKLGVETELVVKGDSKSVSIAAASIVAKYLRDVIMQSIDQEFPQYGFKGHMGYPTAAHLEAIALHGPCPFHRMSFKSLAPYRSSSVAAKTR